MLYYVSLPPPIPNILRATLPGLTRFCNTRISQLVVLDYPGYQWFFSRTTRSFAADISCFVPKYGRNFDPLELDRLALTHYILRYTHNMGASIIANRKKENLPPLGYCLCLQSTPFSAFSSLFRETTGNTAAFARQPEVIFLHVCLRGVGGGGVLLIHSLT